MLLLKWKAPETQLKEYRINLDKRVWSQIPVADLGEGPPTSLILDKKKRIAERRKAGRASDKTLPPPLFVTSLSDLSMVNKW